MKVPENGEFEKWQINSTVSILGPAGYKISDEENVSFEYDANHITNKTFESFDSTKFIKVNVRKSIAPLSASYLSTYIVNSYGKNLPAQIDSTEKGIAAFFFDNKTTTGVFFGIVFFDRQHGQLIEIV